MITPLIIVGVLVLFWIIGMYNGLVRLRNHCKDAWAGIDTELKRRYELIPNLVETVRGYAKHEQGVLASVTEARARAVASTGTPAAQAVDENALIGAMRHFFAVAERYPDLKANENFLHLQKELANTEDRIAAARRFFNGNVRDYNTRVEVIPSNIIAALGGFKPQEFFEIEDSSVGASPEVRM